MDGTLTFTEHQPLKSLVARWRNCLTVRTRRNYRAHQKMLRAAYVGYIRALADYGAAVHLTYAAPSIRHCGGRAVYVCTKNYGLPLVTRTGALLAVAWLGLSRSAPRRFQATSH